jgi:hypothetical protein
MMRAGYEKLPSAPQKSYKCVAMPLLLPHAHTPCSHSRLDALSCKRMWRLFHVMFPGWMSTPTLLTWMLLGVNLAGEGAFFALIYDSNDLPSGLVCVELYCFVDSIQMGKFLYELSFVQASWRFTTPASFLASSMVFLPASRWRGLMRSCFARWP